MKRTGQGVERLSRQLADGGRRGTVGFALTALQRRLASSPAAIYQSLKRRRNKLKRRLEEEKRSQRSKALAETLAGPGTDGVPDDSCPACCKRPPRCAMPPGASAS